MTTRKPIGKKVRFEVFKRDKFTCQYCGGKAPTVVLQVDHIHPVAEGGANDYLNLISSCVDCNSGKGKIRISDESAIDKQRKQLELLHERREQMQMMIEWRSSLSQIKHESLQDVANYVNKKMATHSLNETGKKTLEKYVGKYGLAETLEAIDLSAEKYLKFGQDGKHTNESIEVFFTKIGGILSLKSKSPIEQKIAYIKGICRNRFEYIDEQRAHELLEDYVSALRNKSWSDQRILDDLENEVQKESKRARSWSQWRNRIQDWIGDIQKWETPPSQPIPSVSQPILEPEQDFEPPEPTSDEEIGMIIDGLVGRHKDLFEAIEYIAKEFPEIKIEGIRNDLAELVTTHWNLLLSMLGETAFSDIDKDKVIWKTIRESELNKLAKVTSGKQFYLSECLSKLLFELLEMIHFEEYSFSYYEELDAALEKYTRTINGNIG
jgi:hypothetical protein